MVTNSSPETNETMKIATNALIEAQMMSESIGALIDQLVADSLGDAAQFVRLQTVRACLMRLDAAVDPAVEQVVGNHRTALA